MPRETRTLNRPPRTRRTAAPGPRRSTSPKPPKKVNLGHSVTDDRGGDRRRPRDGYSDESSSDQESHRGYNSSDDGRRSRKRSRDVRHINVVTRVPRSLEKSDPRTYEDISDGALLTPDPEPRVPRVIPIRDEAPTVPSSLERASTEGSRRDHRRHAVRTRAAPKRGDRSENGTTGGTVLTGSQRAFRRLGKSEVAHSNEAVQQRSARVQRTRDGQTRPSHRSVAARRRLQQMADQLQKYCYSSGGSTPPRDAARI